MLDTLIGKSMRPTFRTVGMPDRGPDEFSEACSSYDMWM